MRPELRFIRTLQAPDHIVFDERLNRFRVSSKAFGPSKADGGLSGELEQPLLDDGLHATSMYPAVERAVGAAAIGVGQIQELKLRTEHDPVKQNWYHGSVFDIKGSHKKKLERHAVELIEIDQEEAARREALKKDEERALAVTTGT